jgi:hypothetical protein
MSKHGILIEEKNKKELYKNVIRVKKYGEDYTIDEINGIKGIIYNPLKLSSIQLINEEKTVILYGSAIFKSNVRAGDIDVMQLIPLDQQATSLQWIIKNLEYNDLNLEGYFIGDIKCGIVSKFKSLLKYIGSYKNGKIVGYDYNASKYSFNLSNDLLERQLILPKQIKSLNDYINYLKCYDLAHELITRRWTPEDIKNGYVSNDDGTEYTLKQATYESELTKLDMFRFLNDNFKEITNSLFDDKKEYKKDVFEDELTFNMLIQYYAKGKLLKSIKRMYALKRMQKDEKMTLLLHDFTQRSIVGAYNSIINNLKVYIDIVERHGIKFNDNNDDRKRRLRQHIGGIIVSVQKLYNPYYEYYREIILLLDDIDDMISENKWNEKFIFDQIKMCNKIIDFFDEKIEIICKEFIKENKIDFSSYIKF